MRRLVVSAVMLALGVALGGAAYALPGTKAPHGAIREGGVFRVSMGFELFDSIDPALAYSGPTWRLLRATCAKLLNYPDERAPAGLRAVPEVAAGYPQISPNGRVYRFTIRPGLRFSDGAKLTAASFARAIERIRELKSDGGLQYVQDIAGVVARGRRLTIRLTQPIPDFPARLAMPFFCAVPPRLPADPEGVSAPIHSAGPYYVADYRPGKRVVLQRNRYYGGKRPHHVRRFDVELTSSPEVIDQFERGAADYAVPRGATFSAQARELVRKYVPSGRLSFRPGADLRLLVLNTERPLLRNNARLRRAVNLAVDRRKLVDALGYKVARPTDQYLPPGFPGFQDARIYPFRPNVEKARALASGRLRGGKAVLYVGTVSIASAQVVVANLAKIGLDVEIKAFPISLLFEKLATRGEPFDIAFQAWGSDYNDPYAWINVLLDGRRIGRPHNLNWSYFDSPKYNRLMDRASRLSGSKRYRAYAKLEHRLVSAAAPMVAFAVVNTPTLVSARVDPRCKILNPGLDLAAVCLKR